MHFVKTDITVRRKILKKIKQYSNIVFTSENNIPILL